MEGLGSHQSCKYEASWQGCGRVNRSGLLGRLQREGPETRRCQPPRVTHIALREYRNYQDRSGIKPNVNSNNTVYVKFLVSWGQNEFLTTTKKNEENMKARYPVELQSRGYLTILRGQNNVTLSEGTFGACERWVASINLSDS